MPWPPTYTTASTEYQTILRDVLHKSAGPGAADRSDSDELSWVAYASLPGNEVLEPLTFLTQRVF